MALVHRAEHAAAAPRRPRYYTRTPPHGAGGLRRRERAKAFRAGAASALSAAPGGRLEHRHAPCPCCRPCLHSLLSPRFDTCVCVSPPAVARTVVRTSWTMRHSLSRRDTHTTATPCRLPPPSLRSTHPHHPLRAGDPGRPPRRAPPGAAHHPPVTAIPHSGQLPHARISRLHSSTST